ncbi:MAG TPA: glycosyltransferase family 2 protein [Solirubrobacteraceae bacterium]|jgi:GT2 family glycosyltransferase
MDAPQWASSQRELRDAVRAHRRSADGHSPVPPGERTRPVASRLVDVAASRPATQVAEIMASVIVVCWNAGDVLGRCLDQLLVQRYASFEIIVVDDGSDDDTLEVAERFVGSGRLRIVRSSANRGVAHARNLGVRDARGEIVAFIDADGFAAPDWLARIVEAFDEETIGAVASTVFFDANPAVLNGAGGIVNRQGWAADLCMNDSYERAEIAREALYPMGCGMALRRRALERVGPFDERMLNYYDDVDYGTRLWRAGYRVAVAADAWIDHGFGKGGAGSARKQLLCERHRMRVALKHAPGRSLLEWIGHEARSLSQATPSRRRVKLRAMAWNARHLAGVLSARRRLRQAPRVPERLVAPSWGDSFPLGLPSRLTPRPEVAQSSIDVGESSSEGQLIHGWFPPEPAAGRTHRWAGAFAALFLSVREPVRCLRIDYAHVPVDTGGVELSIRRVGSFDPLASVWEAHLPWQYIARSVENHPLELPAGDYELTFAAVRGWPEPPLGARSLGFALVRLALEESLEITPGGLDMASQSAEGQLAGGWFEAEDGSAGRFRWGTGHAAALIRLVDGAAAASITYRLPPGSIGTLAIAVRSLDTRQAEWSTLIPWRDGDWHEESLPIGLSPGDYLVTFDSERTWSNPDGGDTTAPAENRGLGFALSDLRFT